MPNLHTKRGKLTRYGLACGYTETRGTSEAYVRLEQICSNGALRVVASGRWLRKEVYAGSRLAEARKAFRTFDLEGTAHAATL
jgi:hypothetical protein